jgi:hypothetical protein
MRYSHGPRRKSAEKGKERKENVHREISVVTVGLILFAIGASAQNNSKIAAPNRVLSVKLNYTGAGTVDEKHKIYVLVFDADPYTAQVLAEGASKPPAAAGADAPKTAYVLARQAALTKNATVSFSGLRESTVYVAAFYDKTGTYNGTNDPGHGSPTGLYGTPGKPAPIPLLEGKPVEIVIAFDDSVATP